MHYLTLTLDGVKVTQNVAQYPPHHVTYAPANFEVAMFNGKESTSFDLNIGVKVTQNVAQFPSTSCDLCTRKDPRL